MEGCVWLSSELLDPHFPVLRDEIAARASGRLSSSSWLKLNCLTSLFLRLVLGLDLAGLSVVELWSGRRDVFSVVRLEVAESRES